MNRNLYHSGNLIARNQISLKARILHQKVSIFQFVFARRIASSPVHSISLVKGTQASIPSCCFFVFFWKYSQKRFWKHFSPIPLDVHSISIPNSRRRKGNLSVDGGEQRGSILIPCVPNFLLKMKTKRNWFPNQARNYADSGLFNCLIQQKTCELLEISSLD